jgi:hypothetical protein
MSADRVAGKALAIVKTPKCLTPDDYRRIRREKAEKKERQKKKQGRLA